MRYMLKVPLFSGTQLLLIVSKTAQWRRRRGEGDTIYYQKKRFRQNLKSLTPENIRIVKLLFPVSMQYAPCNNVYTMELKDCYYVSFTGIIITAVPFPTLIIVLLFLLRRR